MYKVMIHVFLSINFRFKIELVIDSIQARYLMNIFASEIEMLLDNLYLVVLFLHRPYNSVIKLLAHGSGIRYTLTRLVTTFGT